MRPSVLQALRAAAEGLGLEPWAAGNGDLVFTCPICRVAGKRNLAGIRVVDPHKVAVTCASASEKGGGDEWIEVEVFPQADEVPGVWGGEYWVYIGVLVFGRLCEVHGERLPVADPSPLGDPDAIPF